MTWGEFIKEVTPDFLQDIMVSIFGTLFVVGLVTMLGWPVHGTDVFLVFIGNVILRCWWISSKD